MAAIDWKIASAQQSGLTDTMLALELFLPPGNFLPSEYIIYFLTLFFCFVLFYKAWLIKDEKITKDFFPFGLKFSIS